MAVKFSNNAATTLASGISGGATSFTVVSNTGFPTLGGSDWTYVTIDSEVVKVTAISGTTFTCDATSGAHSTSDNVELRMTAELLDDFAEDLDIYTHPTSAGNKHIPTGGSSGEFLKYDSSGTAVWAADNDTVYTHPNHTGEVTSTNDGATVIADDTVDEANLKISNAGSNGQYLQKQTGDTGGLTWADVDALPSQTGNAGKYLTTDASDASWATLDTDANTTTKGLYEHAHTISADYTISSSNNALSASPITIDTGYSVTVSSGSTWIIV